MVVMTLPYAQSVMRDQPLRYYRLSETNGTTAVDAMGNANGTFQGGVTLGQTGLIKGDPNTAVLLDGSTGYLSMPTSGLPSGSQAFSIEFWMNLTVGQATGHAIMKVGNDTNLQQVALYYTVSGAFVNLYTGTSHTTGANAAPAGTICHFVVTYNGTTLILYTNGQNVVQTTIALNLTYGIAYIGNDDFSEPVQGILDEVAVYSNALTADQITHHYHAGIDGLILSQRLPRWGERTIL